MGQLDPIVPLWFRRQKLEANFVRNYQNEIVEFVHRFDGFKLRAPEHKLGTATLLHDKDTMRATSDSGKSVLVFRFKDDGGKKVFDGDGTRWLSYLNHHFLSLSLSLNLLSVNAQ